MWATYLKPEGGDIYIHTHTFRYVCVCVYTFLYSLFNPHFLSHKRYNIKKILHVILCICMYYTMCIYTHFYSLFNPHFLSHKKYNIKRYYIYILYIYMYYTVCVCMCVFSILIIQAMYLPPLHNCCIFTSICRHECSGETLESPSVHVPSGGWTKPHCCLVSALML